MDLSKLSDNDLVALRDKNLNGMSDEGLRYLSSLGKPTAPEIKPDTGFTGAMKASAQQIQADFERLKGRTGFKNADIAEQEAKAYEKKAGQVFKPTEESWTEAPWQKLKETAGGSLPYMAAPLAAGAAALTLPASLPTAAIATGLGGIASATQFTGSNLSRQQQEDPNLKLQDTSLSSAALASIPQAALDMVGFRYIPGIQRIFKSAGKEISEQAAKKMLDQGIMKTAGQYIAGGVKISGIEGATEAGQQVFERLQAGLNIADKQARDEYFDSFIGGAALGAIASPFGVRGQRGQAKEVVAKAETKRADELAAEQQAKEAEQTAQTEQAPPPVDVNAEQSRLLNMRFSMENQQGILKRQLDGLRTQAQKETDVDKLAEISAQAKALQSDIDAYDPDKIKSQMAVLKKENIGLTKDLKEVTKTEDQQAIQDITTKIAQNNTTAAELNDKIKAFSIKQQVSRAPEELDKKLKSAQIALQKAKDEGDLDAVGKIVQNIKSFEEEKAKYPGAHVQDYNRRIAQYKNEIAQRTQDTLYQETEAEKAEREIAESKGEPVKRQPYKEEMAPADYEDRLAQNIVDLFTQQEKALPTKLTFEQRKAEAKRVAKLDEYDKKFKDAITYYEKLNAEAEEKAAAGAESKGAKLYGDRGVLLQKGQELQDALAAMMKAKGDLINAIPKGKKTPVESVKGLAAAQDVNLLDLTDTIDSMRKGEFFGGPNPQAATGSLATKASKARKFLDQYIQATVSSIDFARQAKGLTPLTDTEKTNIVEQIDSLMDNKIQRATGKLARKLKAGEEAAPEDTLMRDAFTKAGFKFAPIETGEREIKTGFSRNEFKDVQRFTEGLKNKYTNKPVKEIGKLQRIPAGVSAKEAARTVELEKRVAEKNKIEAAKPKKTIKERVTKEQQEAAQKTGLGLPGIKQEFATLPKGEAALPHNYDAVQAPFNFARRYYKELIARRSLMMNKKQQEAFKKNRDDYKAAKVKLEKAFKENNVDPKIAKIMRDMVEMKEGTPKYRTQENLILGREEQLQQRVVGIKPELKKTEIKPAKEIAEETKLKEELGYKELEITKEEKAVGRISEVKLAGVRSKLNKRLEEVRNRVYGLGIKAEEKTNKERATLAKEQTKLEKEIKSIDEVLNARRLGMIIGQAQEEKGARRDKATKTEKKMTKAGAFEHAGITPGVYEQVVKTVKEAELSEPKLRPKQTRMPQAAKTLISKLADVEYRIEKEKLTPTDKSVLVREATALRKQINEELTKKQKDLEELFKIEAKEASIDPKEYEAIMRDVDNGNFDAREEKVAEGSKRVTQDEVHKLLKGVKLPKGLKITVFGELPAGLRKYIKEQGYNPDSIRGAVTQNGNVFIVAGNHANLKDVERTIAHEVTGHLGVENLIGEAGMDALAKRVAKQEGGVMGLAEKLGVQEEALGAYMSAKQLGKSDEFAAAKALREVIAHTEEARIDKNFLGKANEFIKALVGAVRAALRKIGLDLDLNTSDVYKMLRDARKEFDAVTPGMYKGRDGEIQVRSGGAKYGPGGVVVADAADKILTQKQKQKILPANFGLLFEQRVVSATAALMRAFENKGMKNSIDALQTKYYIANHNQRFVWASHALTNGVPVLEPVKRSDGKTEYVLKQSKGASVQGIIDALSKAKWGNAQGVNNVWSLHRILLRAKSVGFDKLNFDKAEVTEKLLQANEAVINSNPSLKAAIKEADDIYNQYNRDLLTRFLVSTGAMSKELANNLVKGDAYIPYYRKETDGTIVLDLNEGVKNIRIGNIKDQPYLKELVGGNERIVDAFTGILQNTNLLMDMGLRNLATRQTAFALDSMGLLEKGKDKEGIEKRTGIRKGHNIASDKAIRFYLNGDPVYAVVDTETVGVPSELVVEGLGGVSTSVPTIVKMMGIPASILRTFITRNPVYALRQAARDPLNAVMTNGIELKAMGNSYKILGKALRGDKEATSDVFKYGITGSNVYTGTVEDMQKQMMRMLDGKNGIDNFYAKLDTLAVNADSATRQAAFTNFRKQGMTEMEAMLATYELMPFTQRGTSASVFWLSTMVPFLNAQIQGLNVLWKAMSGKATFQEKLKVKQQFYAKGAMMFGMSIAYAILMSDDEAYQNANDDEKYNNWFVYTPFSKEPFKVPIPFELGILFKSIPEAMVNVARGDKEVGEALNAIRKLIQNNSPIGLSSLPQAIKPIIEITADYSFYTGRGIVGERLKGVDPSERYNANTNEILKLIGKGTGSIPVLGEYLSPVQLEYLIRGYFGSLPLALASITNPAFSTGEAPEGRGIVSSTTPVIGSLFQPLDANGMINRAYKDMESIQRTKATYNKFIEDGNEKGISKLLDAEADKLNLAPLAGNFRSRMGNLAKEERRIKSDPDMSAAEKRELLDMIKEEKIGLSKELISARE